MNKNFVLIGAAGYIAPKHVKAIKDLNCNLVAALDPHDSVGYLDAFFPNCAFFTEFERLDRHISKLLDKGSNIDYVSVCSPNYLHDSHCRAGLRWGADVVCEKPLVLYTRNLDNLLKIEQQTGHKIFNILQLRLNPTLQQLRQKIKLEPRDKKRQIYLKYYTYRGPWYRYSSWKSITEKSGGLITNIGVHLIDLVLWLFGSDYEFSIYQSSKTRIIGMIRIVNNEIEFDLSIDEPEVKRELKIDGESIDISHGFTDAHTKSYMEILNGNGFIINDVYETIKLVEKIRNVVR